MTSSIPLWFDHFATPIGELALLVDDEGRLRAVGFTSGHDRMQTQLTTAPANARKATNPAGLSAALRAYFEGELSAIDGLPIVFGGTAFQRTVWQALLEIPCGETRSYGQLARDIGNPNAVRAVGLANGANPIGIVVPCHRVIGADGTLTGYGGGIERKRWLLAHERGQRIAMQLPLPSTQEAATR
jgi:methylated-DNA-[protein]-cysteine S-methyltransferase